MDRLLGVLMKISFNLYVIMIIKNLIYCIDLSHNAKVFT